MVEQEQLYFFPVSKLSHFDFCPKRAKIELFKQDDGTFTYKGRGCVVNGNRLHYVYSYPNKNFDRMMLRAKLKSRFTIFEKRIDNIVVRGVYDDLRVIRYNMMKFTALIEVKTTSKKYMWAQELAAAIRQLQLYMWMLKDILEAFGFPLWRRSYVEVYKQQTGELIRRIPVEYDDGIEQWIRDVVLCFKGLKRVGMPNFKVCRSCPVGVKRNCDWYRMMRGRMYEE